MKSLPCAAGVAARIWLPGGMIRILLGAIIVLAGTSVLSASLNFSYAWALLAKQTAGGQLTPEEVAYVARARALPLNAVPEPPAAAPEGPREFYVDNVNGDDNATGLGSSPVKSLSRAVALLHPGDTLHFACNDIPYTETLQLNDLSGTPEQPIIIDGHGATISGEDPIDVRDWIEQTPGLYRNDRLIDELVETDDETKLKRMFFRIGGAMQRMGRTSKGRKAPLKDPGELAPGEWTFDFGSRAFFLRVDGPLPEAEVTVPIRRCGVALLSLKGIEHVVIRNLTIIGVLNDGFNLHGYGIRNVRFENIAAYECGDDGFSPHEDAECSIDGYCASRNSTALAVVGSAQLRARRLACGGNFATEVMVADAACLFLSASSISTRKGTPPLQAQHPAGLELHMDGVELDLPAGESPEMPSGVILGGRGVSVTASRR